MSAPSLNQAWHHREWRFLLTFLGLCTLAAVSTPSTAPLQAGLAGAFAEAVEIISNAVGVRAVRLPGNVVEFADGEFMYRVAEACSAFEVALIYAAGVLAYPGAPWRKRAWGLFWGVLVVLTVNLMRLLALAWAGVAGAPNVFDALHTYWGSAALLVAVGPLWWAWAKWSETPHTPAASSGWGQNTTLRRGATAGLLFAGVLAAFWWGAALTQAPQTYTGWVAAAHAFVLTEIFGIDPDLGPGWGSTLAWWYYAHPAAVVALFTATTHIPWRPRLLAAALGAGLVFTFQVVILVGARVLTERMGQPPALWWYLVLYFHMAVVMGIWFAWARKNSDRQVHVTRPQPSKSGRPKKL